MKKSYSKPETEVRKIFFGQSLLAGSPGVRTTTGKADDSEVLSRDDGYYGYYGYYGYGGFRHRSVWDD